MAKKIARKKKPSFNLTEMTNTQIEFHQIKEQRKMLEEREKQLKERLDKFLTATITPDSKGHYLHTVIGKNGEKLHLQKQARKKITLNEEKALEYLEEHGHDDLIITKNVIAEEVTQDQVIEVLEKYAKHLLDEKTVVDEIGLEQAVLKEEIPMDEFEELCNIDITYAMAFVKDHLLEREGEQDAPKRRGKSI